MQIRRLKYFIAVAEELHFGRAAERLHIAQPPLSQQIQRLEQELGLVLFDRNRHSVRLTKAGEELLVEARRAVAQSDRVAAVAQNIRTGESGRVRIGFVGSALYAGVPAMIRELRQAAPDIRITASEMETGAQLMAINNDMIDLGVVRTPLSTNELAVHVITTDDLVVALPHDHRLARSHSLELAQLANEPFVFFKPEEGRGFWEVVISACASAGFTPRVEYEAEHIHTMVGMVAAGVGVSLVPEPVRALNLWGVRYVPLTPPVPRLPLALAWDARRSFAALDRVVEVLTSSGPRFRPAIPVR
ncbi:MAG TPA: LysR family transcriptional regulator [Homoserinimonas sp.]|nr:LysR family transcriptional regulator [Homoserinimonas sp.]